MKTTKSQYGSTHLYIILVFIVALLVVLGFVFWQSFTGKAVSPAGVASSSSKEDSIESRDDKRKRYVARFATDLFRVHIIQKQSPEMSQEGFDSFAMGGSQEPIVDPLTKTSYIFNDNQTAMKVGEVTFRMNATCDNKIKGSNKTGLIVDASSSSVAVALRLESGEYACESNL
ncbi:hypothetical protein H7X68_01340 [Candidatus Saccharibacteria bacterium]|nr:hypothetical protein [Candidatus Saccharibacteria bacterium]